MISWSNRGQGSCPNCATVYFNRSKPVECSNCGYHLGGSAAAKMPKLSCPVAVHIHGGLYSVRTSTRDDRCFVYKECDNWICLHSKCKDIRAMYVSSNRTDEFSCQHLKHVAESVEAVAFFLSPKTKYLLTPLTQFSLAEHKLYRAVSWSAI